MIPVLLRSNAVPVPLEPFAVDRARDPEGVQLRALLRADFHASNLANVRNLLVTLLALAAVALAVMVLSPSLGGPSMRRDVAGGWMTIAALTTAVAWAERTWSRRRGRILEQIGAGR